MNLYVATGQRQFAQDGLKQGALKDEIKVKNWDFNPEISFLNFIACDIDPL